MVFWATISFTIGRVVAGALTCAEASPAGNPVAAANPTAVITAGRRGHREFFIQSPRSTHGLRRGRAAAAKAQHWVKPRSSRCDVLKAFCVAFYAEKVFYVTKLISATLRGADEPGDRDQAC
jgi:hypothetical protein